MATYPFNVTTPIGDSTDHPPSQGDDRIREIKLALQERLNKDGYWPLSGDACDVDDVGYWRKLTLLVQASAPTKKADAGILYTKDVGDPAKAELFFIDEDGDEVQITSGGALIDTLFSGLIVMWSGTIANIPSGYVICDGNNSTPNLLGRMIRQVATAATNPGATGGSATGAHTHGAGSYTASAHTHGAGSYWGPSHTHGVGSFARPSHTHGVGSYAGPSHTHPVPYSGWQRAGGSTLGQTGTLVTQDPDTGNPITNAEAISAYNTSGAGGTGAVVGTSAAGGAGAVTGTSAAGGSYAITGTSASGGEDVIAGTSASGTTLPLYYDLAFLMKT